MHITSVVFNWPYPPEPGKQMIPTDLALWSLFVLLLCVPAIGILLVIRGRLLRHLNRRYDVVGEDADGFQTRQLRRPAARSSKGKSPLDD